jgi:xanthine dehydrogenase YagS FAD-binding subunit
VNRFKYVAVASASEALLELAQTDGARFIAGGTTILDLMKDGVEAPSVLVDLNALPLGAIERRGNALHIGATARMSDLAAHPIVREQLPVIAIALEQSASPQLRTMATIAGNLLQRTRCPYFRDRATPCNKRAPGTGCSAIGGENRRQAVLGTSEHCIAAHASDLAVALASLGAVVHVESATKTREVPIVEFYRPPGETPQVETVLRADELIVAVTVPLLPFAKRSIYLKVRDRAQYDFALASAAVVLDIAGGTIREARVALGGVATVPWRATEAEEVLSGRAVSRASFERAADAVFSGARGHGHNDFKIALGKRTLVRALEMCAHYGR